MNKKVMQSYILIIYTKYHSQNTQSNQSIITIRAYWQDNNNEFSSILIMNQDCIIQFRSYIAVGKIIKTLKQKINTKLTNLTQKLK